MKTVERRKGRRRAYREGGRGRLNEGYIVSRKGIELQAIDFPFHDILSRSLCIVK